MKTYSLLEIPLKSEIAYICDRKRCSKCYSACQHTTDKKHAKNLMDIFLFDSVNLKFQKVGPKKYMEVEAC